MLGSFPLLSEIDKAIMIMSKVEFTEESFATVDDNKSFLKNTELKSIIVNDIYADFIGSVSSELNSMWSHFFTMNSSNRFLL